MSKEKILLFGAGSSGESMLSRIPELVIGFLDNDTSKHWTQLKNLPVYPPDHVKHLEFDAIVVSSTYHLEIKRQLIKMGLSHKIKDLPTASALNDTTTPVNYQIVNANHEEIRQQANYALQVAEGYLNKFDDGRAFFLNKTILELGPGTNFGSALTLLSMGAQQVAVCDRFLVPFQEGYHDTLYHDLSEKIICKYPDANVEVLLTCANNKSHQSDALLLVQKPLEKLSELFRDTFDITLSNAVFEHLFNPLAAIMSLWDCTSAGGRGSHQVDFRDHRDFSRPLEFLLYDEFTFMNLMHKACCEFGNRVRPSQMGAMLQMAGFKNIEYSSNLSVNPDYMDEFIPRLRNASCSAYSRWGRGDLLSVSGNFMMQK